MPLRSTKPKRRRLAAAGVIAAIAALAAPSVSAAASPPAVSTESAIGVQATSAILRGIINPEGQSTSYFFQYGRSRSYGAQTPVMSTPSATSTTHVVVAVSGLSSLSGYHFRLIAVNSTGASTGSDQLFTTLAIPLSLSIAVTPSPAPFGSDASVSGTLSGTGAAERAVVLQASAFPFTAGFVAVGNPQLTSASGAFFFPVLGLTQVTQYRVLTTSAPLISSPVWLENVAVRVGVHVARAQRMHFVRFYGTVTPAEVGMQIGIMRVIHGRNVLIAGTLLRPGGANFSRYSRVVHVVHGGIYRVLARITDGAHASAYSAPVRIG
jgi:hypothetical protein